MLNNIRCIKRKKTEECLILPPHIKIQNLQLERYEAIFF
jgi:hypothetical protein